MIKISTKTGDAGLSSLANGQRLPKTHSVFGLLGELDELNSWFGLVVAQLQRLSGTKKLNKIDSQVVDREIKLLLRLQAWLYQMSALIAGAPQFKLTLHPLQQIERAEEQLQALLAPGWHTHFLYPGGSELGGWLDIARAVTRRVERSFLLWQSSEENHLHANKGQVRTHETIQKTLNRISDYLYLLRCWCNIVQSIDEKEFLSDAEV